MIKATYCLNGVDDIFATLTVTMPVRYWKDLIANMSVDKWPEWEFRAKIAEMIRHANEVFDARQGETV